MTTIIMVKLDKYYKINYEESDYAVCELAYNSKKVPMILDWDIFKKVKNLDRNWHINEKGFVVTNFKTSDNGVNLVKEISMHDVVMRMVGGAVNVTNKSILHINKLGVDNRECNLMYDTCNKEITKNLKKKSRTISLPKNLGVTPEEIPSYVWYLKEDNTHGDRFVVEIGDVKWKSTGSKKVSLKYKLEETKKYMRYLKDTRPDIFEDHSMNGDLNNDGIDLTNDFLKISQKAGYKLNGNLMETNTDKYLCQNLKGLSEEELIFLEMFNPEVGRLDFR